MSDAFISYSHLDRDFAVRLQRALKDSGKDIWVDESDIRSGARWAEELKSAIEDADSFVFVISPDSVASEECKQELSYAAELNKRIIPLNLRLTPLVDLPEAIKAVQFVPPRGLFENDPDSSSESTFENSLPLLITTIDTDLDATREHTEWGKKALEWDKHTRDRSFLLSGSELEAAEQWLVRGSGKGPEPTDLQKSYVLVSRQGATRRQRRLLGGVTIALVVALVLGGLALIQTHSAQVQRNNAISQSHLSQSEDMAAEATNLFSTNAPLGMLVSLQAYERAPTLQAEDALVKAAEQPLDTTLSEGITVNSVASSPNGQTLAVGDADGDVGLWSTASGKRIATLSEGSEVGSVAFSPNGQTLAVGDADGDVGLWSTASGKRIATLSEGSEVGSVAFSPNGQTLAVGDADGDVGLWSTARKKRMATLSEGKNPASSVAFSPNGQTLAVGDLGGDVGLWSTASGTRTATRSEGNSVNSVAFSPNGQTLAVGDNIGDVGLWNTSREKRTTTLSEGNRVDSVAFSPNGQTLAVGHFGGDVGLWSTSIKKRTATLSEGSRVDSVAFSPNGQTLAVGDFGGDVGLWSTASGTRTATLSEGSEVDGVAFSPDGQTLALGDSIGKVRLLRPSLWNWKFNSFLHVLCGEVRRSMTQVQWMANVPNQSYQRTCCLLIGQTCASLRCT